MSGFLAIYVNIKLHKKTVIEKEKKTDILNDLKKKSRQRN